MNPHRRRFLALAAASVAGASVPALAATKPSPIGALGADATHFGLRPGDPDDQSRALQRAIDECAKTRAPLAFPPGVYRAGNVNLADGTQLLGVRGATRLVLTHGPSLLAARGTGHITLSGLVIDGGHRKLPERRGLVHGESLRGVRITDCDIVDTSTGLYLVGTGGEISGASLTNLADVAIFSLDATGLTISRNTISGAGNNGILVFRSQPGDDGTIVADNRIANINNSSGGSGQYGNAVNAFRAANVIVRGNRIRNCAFSAIRGNSASNIQIAGNSITAAREVAIYSEFAFEGAVIAHNTIDGAAIGVSVTNFNKGGRLAVIEGNIVRNLLPKRPAGTDPGDGAGIGLYAEADTAVTGNVVENAPHAGILVGWGRHLRDVSVSGNVVRKADIGIGASVSPGAGTALIANNVIAETVRGAIVGMDHHRIASGDLTKGGAERYANLTISGNRVR
jgi:uncharacterized secreted repeat protein (TIGR03808 family)